jgi:hypothetical protein
MGWLLDDEATQNRVSMPMTPRDIDYWRGAMRGGSGTAAQIGLGHLRSSSASLCKHMNGFGSLLVSARFKFCGGCEKVEL